MVFINYLDTVYANEESLANSKSDKFKNDIAETINKVSKQLGLEKEIEIKLEKRKKSTPKLAIDGSTKIAFYSEGQRHKLALAIFFATIPS